MRYVQAIAWAYEMARASGVWDVAAFRENVRIALSHYRDTASGKNE